MNSITEKAAEIEQKHVPNLDASFEAEFARAVELGRLRGWIRPPAKVKPSPSGLAPVVRPRPPKRTGFTLVEIMIVVAIIGLLAAIAIPNFVKARATAQANACINNLRQIDSAANEFALEQHKKTGDTINFPSDLTPYIKLNAAGSIPACPAGGVYADNSVGNSPTCSLGNTVTPGHYLP